MSPFRAAIVAALADMSDATGVPYPSGYRAIADAAASFLIDGGLVR